MIAYFFSLSPGWRSIMVSRTVRKGAFLLFLWGFLVICLIQLKSTPSKISNNIVGTKFLQNFLSHPSLQRTLEGRFGGNFIDAEVNIDKSNSHSENEIVEEVQRLLPSLPIAYWNTHKNKNLPQKNDSCSKYPSIFDLEFNNVYWQSLYSTNGTFYLFGAYYDVRRLSKIGPAVRILGMINRIEPTIKTSCLFWFENNSAPVVVKVMEYKYIWYKKWGNYKQGIFQPYLIACQIPKQFHHLVPSSVSLVEKICDMPTNNLRVIYERPKKKKGFAVCVKGLDFLYNDLSVRLIEWIELLGLLGAEKIFFYNLQVHPNISKVLNHYESRGKIQVTPLTLPGGQPNLPGFQHIYLTKKINNKRQNELIPYNDCLYKNLYSYEYIALLDIDEVIMPLKTDSWGELMKVVQAKSLAIKNETRASYNVRNVYFLDDLIHSHGWFNDIPKYMHMLQHVYRSVNFTKPNQYVKCFHNPERALILHNHFPLACLSSGCTSYAIDTADAQLQHYRADCVKTLKKTCSQYRNNSVIDKTIWKFKEALIARTTDALYNLGYFVTYR